MNKKLSVILGLLLGGSAMLGAACSKDNGSNSVAIQSTYNTLKVMQDGKYEALGQKMDVLMYKGETESGQLIVTPEKDVASLVLNTADLTLEGNESVVFSKDNIQVYLQKYINITVKTAKNENGNYPVGYTPDMLLPQDIAVEYKENNVKGGLNQGITVEFTTTASTQAGTYKGEFTLVADGVSYAVPVTLEVYDLTVSKAFGKTCMVAGAHHTMVGEYDTTKDSYRRYYEKAMNEYKFMFEFLPNSLDPQAMAESAVYYWDNPNFTSFNIPNGTYSSGNFEIANQLKLGDLYEYYWALGIASKPGMILFDKAYLYLKHVDEARPEKYKVVAESTQDVYNVQLKVFNDLEASGYFDEYDETYKEAFYKSINGVPIILTGDTTQADSLGASVNTYCARIDTINTPIQREKLEDIQAENADKGGEIWYYTCMEPTYPMPSHHIDDMLLSSRTMRWMQKDWNMDGYLYWQTFSYAMWTGSETVTVDPYEDPMRFPNINGDGYLAYPGKKYGLDAFLGSVRLLSFRDGQEDYNLLCTFEERLKEKAAYYGLDASTVSSKLYLDEYYSQLYTGAVASEDDALFNEVKRNVFDLLLKHQSDTQFYVVNDSTNTSVTSNIYLANGYELTVNGNTLTGVAAGNGMKYQLVQSLDKAANLDVVIKKDGVVVETHKLTVGEKTANAPFVENTVSLSEESSASLADGKANVTIKSGGESKKDMMVFTPYVTLKSALFDGFNLDELSKVSFNLTNNGTEDCVFSIRFKSGSSIYNLNSYTVKAGETRQIVLDSVNEYLGVYQRLAQAEIQLTFENIYQDENGEYVKYADRDLTLSDLYYTCKEGNN